MFKFTATRLKYISVYLLNSVDSINKAKLKSLTDSKVTEKSDYVKRAKSRFGHFGKLSLSFLSSLFVIRVNLLHP